MAKVLFIITQSEIGGAQRFLLEFAPYLVSLGYHVSVAAGEGDGELFEKLESRIKNLEFRTYSTGWLVRNLNPLKDSVALFRIFQIIKKEKPDVLFLQSTKAGFLGSLTAKLFKILNSKFQILIVYRIGGWAFNDPRPWWMNKIVFWMEKLSARWKEVIIVNSEYDRQLAIDKKIAPADKIVKIYNGIDADKINFLEREEAKKVILSKITTSPPSPLSLRKRGGSHGGQGGVIVGTIANLYATKGIEYLIEAARDCQLSIVNCRLLFIVLGDGPERSKLEALIKKYNLENNFFLLGRLPSATQYLKAFDIFVLPSVKEGFPWVLLEAMAAEVPIVATKAGAVPEAIEDGKDGLLVPPKDARSLAQKILYFVDIQDTHDRELFVKHASEKLKHFSLQKMLRDAEDVLNLNYDRHTRGQSGTDPTRF